MENIRYEVWLQNHDKFATVYNCPNTENTGVNMNFIDPIFFRIRTIVHCVTNSM